MSQFGAVLMDARLNQWHPETIRALNRQAPKAILQNSGSFPGPWFGPNYVNAILRFESHSQ